MKYIFAFSVLLIVACSQTSSTESPDFQPGGKFYMTPGTFTGYWIRSSDSSTILNYDTTLCTATFTETDSLLRGTITNNSSKEVVTISGFHTTSPEFDVLHQYAVTTTSNLNDTFLSEPLNFFGNNGDTLISVMGEYSLQPSGQIITPGYFIVIYAYRN
ncbi:MAG: hypothetical protein ACHQNE_04015 [Candidatus Kapaibacterium sp.]